MELVAPRAGEIAVNTARAFPGAVLAIAGVLILGTVVAARALTRPSAPALSAKALRRALLPPAKRIKALAHKAARTVAA
jgi:hypothetical protein